MIYDNFFRWPGASLTIIRGHKHLHECAFIGDDSSEELEELLEIAEERGILNGTGLSQLKKVRLALIFNLHCKLLHNYIYSSV